MALRTHYLALMLLATIAGVFAGASDAWPRNPQGNPQVFHIRTTFSPTPF